MSCTAALFEYFRENPTHWPGCLNALGGKSSVEIPIPWAVHESIKGIRDFSRTSRLRIERALSLCNESGMSVRAVTGFDPFLEATPLWARSNWEIPALIPTSRVHQRPLGCELSSLASVHDFEFKSAWFAFLDELFSILALYVQPEGPLEQVEVQLDFFSLDQGALRSPTFVEALKKRYRTIEQLNLRYRSSFRGFESVCSSQGFRVLLDKRPWHAIYDYRWCRKELLESLAAEIRALPSAEPISDRLSVRTQPPSPLRTIESTVSVCVDSCFVETWHHLGQQFSGPVTPEGYLHPQASLALRIWHSIQTRATQDGAAAFLLPLFSDLSTIPHSPYRVFVCGRYLPANLAADIQQYVAMGGQAIFPFGMPQFDDALQPLVWKQTSMTSRDLPRSQAVVRRLGRGAIWVPAQLPTMDDAFWDEIMDFTTQIQSEGMN